MTNFGVFAVSRSTVPSSHGLIRPSDGQTRGSHGSGHIGCGQSANGLGNLRRPFFDPRLAKSRPLGCLIADILRLGPGLSLAARALRLDDPSNSPSDARALKCLSQRSSVSLGPNLGSPSRCLRTKAARCAQRRSTRPREPRSGSE